MSLFPLRSDLKIIGAAAILALATPARADSEIGLRRSGSEISPARATAPEERPGWRGAGFEEPAMSSGSVAVRGRRDAAAPPEPPERRVSRNVQYIVFDQGLDTVLSELGRLAGYTVLPSREVRGAIPPGKLEGAADELIEQLRRAHRLVTMRDGPQLIVAAESESVTRVMKTGGESTERVREVLRNLSIDDVRRRVAVDERSGLIQMSAPPIIMERIETILANATKSAGAPAEGITVVRFGRRSAE